MSAIRLAMLGAALCASTSVTAAVTSYNNLASFSAAAGPLNLETVNGFTTETSFQTSPVALGGGAFQVQGYGSGQANRNFVDLQPPQFSVFNVDGTTLLNTTVNADGSSGFEFTFAAPIRAFSFDFGAFQDSANRTFIQVAGVTLNPPVQAGDVVGFYGFVSTTPFTTIRFGANSGRSDGFSMDNLRWGTGGAVPEPASWAMLIAGFGMVGAVSRRRKAVAA